MKKRWFLRQIAAYYLKAAVFAVLSYGLLWIVYGQIGISFMEWLAIMVAAFTVGYITVFIQERKKRRDDHS